MAGTRRPACRQRIGALSEDRCGPAVLGQTNGIKYRSSVIAYLVDNEQDWQG